MTSGTDLQTDYIHLDAGHKATINLVQRLKTGDNTDAGITAIKMDLQQARQTFGGIRIQGSERAWIIPVPELSNVTAVDIGDTITEGSSTYSIFASSLVRFDTQYVVMARKQR
jgi:hypothetical protein